MSNLGSLKVSWRGISRPVSTTASTWRTWGRTTSLDWRRTFPKQSWRKTPGSPLRPSCRRSVRQFFFCFVFLKNTRLIGIHQIQRLTYMFFQVSQLLRKLHIRLMVRKYIRGITPQRKAQVVVSATNAIRLTTLEWWTNKLQEINSDLISLFLASVKSTNQRHVQRKEGKLPLQCVQTIRRHQDW